MVAKYSQIRFSSLSQQLATRLRRKKREDLTTNALFTEADNITLLSNAQPGAISSILHPCFINLITKERLGRLKPYIPTPYLRIGVLSRLVGDNNFAQLCSPYGAPAPPLADAFQQAIFTCGVVPSDKDGVACSREMDINLRHTFNCLQGRYPRHQVLLGAIIDLARACGLPTSGEASMLDSATRPGKKLFADTVIYGLGGLPIYVDATVRSPFRADNACLDNGVVNVAKPAEDAEVQKFAKYGDSASRMGVQFLPAAVTHLGVMGKGILSLLNRMADHITLGEEQAQIQVFSQMRRYVLSATFSRVFRDMYLSLRRVDKTFTRRASFHAAHGHAEA